jgi:hypothetical protein
MHRPGVWLVLGMLAGVTLAPRPAAATTQADASACMGDAFRLCSAAIPDRARVAQCLNDNRRKLSPACAAVFKRGRSAAPAREPAVQKTGL